MSYQLYNIMPEPLAQQNSMPSHLQVERYEIMRALREADAQARFERRELKKIRRDIRRMERRSRRHTATETVRETERV